MAVRAVVIAAILLTGGCTGTRMYQRANRAAAAGDFRTAIAYDAASQRDGRALPASFEASYRQHMIAYLDRWFAGLGEPTDANDRDA